MELIDAELPNFYKYLTFAFLAKGFALPNNIVKTKEIILKARGILG